jgi:nucleotide-binding universal stress UspA family protein
VSYKKIVVGADGSPSSVEAVRRAAELGKASSADVLIVFVFERPNQSMIESIWESGQAERGPALPDELQWKVTPGGTADLVLQEAQSIASSAGVKAETRGVEGHVEDTLLNVAEEEGADLLVVGGRGHSTPSRFGLGAVPDRVSHHAPCDLMIIFGD